MTLLERVLPEVELEALDEPPEQIATTPGRD
jgi:hypothetical protein